MAQLSPSGKVLCVLKICFLRNQHQQTFPNDNNCQRTNIGQLCISASLSRAADSGAARKTPESAVLMSLLDSIS